MKTYTVTLTEDEAHAVGYALRLATKENKAKRADGDAHAADLVQRLESAYRKLDQSKEAEA